MTLKIKHYIVFLTLIFEGFVNFNGFAQNIDKLIPKNYKIIQIERGDLNKDTLDDCAIVIQNPNEMDSQELWVLFKNKNNTYRQIF
jgi:hypothetical protein